MTRRPPASARSAPAPHCLDNDCQRQQVEALTRIADALEGLKPAADTVHDLADRLERMCVFFRKKGPWLLASVPFVISAIGAISPEMAQGLRNIFAAIASTTGAAG